jgi:iron complex transport system substrate-binding protein
MFREIIMQKRWFIGGALIALLSLGAVTYGQDAVATAEATAATESNPQACIEEGEFDPEKDYFPVKAEVEYAKGFTVEYHNSYKVVTVKTPWPGAQETDGLTYILLQCGASLPDNVRFAGPIINVPVTSIVSLSTTYLPHLQDLGAIDKLVAVDSLDYLQNPDVLAMSEAGTVLAVGSGSTINVEQVLDLEPGVVLAFASGLPEYDTHPVLLEAGVPVAVGADYVEDTPLGYAEWIKFTGLFLNEEAEADAAFDLKADEYNVLKELVAAVPAEERPVVLWQSFDNYGGGWFIPGQASYVATLLHDAGATYVMEESDDVQGVASSASFDFETVFEAGQDADVWMPSSYGVNSLADLLAQDERYGDLAPFKAGEVYDMGARVNANGGNDYYETGVTNPQIVLADLIKILHPDLLPDHEFYFARKLE